MCPVHGYFAPCRCGYAVGLAALALVGCGLLPAKAAEPDPCSAEIVKLEAARDAEVLAACAGQSFDACDAVPAIDRKYDPFIQAQIECKQ